MGNPNTEKKKLHKRQIRAREFLKTRTWRTFSDLTPLDHEEILLVYDLTYPHGKGFSYFFEYGHPKSRSFLLLFLGELLE